MLEPIKRAGNQEALHFATAEIVDESIPIVVKALTWIEMLVERGAIKPRQAVRIRRKMRRHPIENYSDIRGMQRIDKTHQPLRRSKARGRRKHAERLIAPGTAERMFSDWQQLDMGESHVDKVR